MAIPSFGEQLSKSLICYEISFKSAHGPECGACLDSALSFDRYGCRRHNGQGPISTFSFFSSRPYARLAAASRLDGASRGGDGAASLPLNCGRGITTTLWPCGSGFSPLDRRSLGLARKNSNLDRRRRQCWNRPIRKQSVPGTAHRVIQNDFFRSTPKQRELAYFGAPGAHPATVPFRHRAQYSRVDSDSRRPDCNGNPGSCPKAFRHERGESIACKKQQ